MKSVLAEKKCTVCRPGTPAMTQAQIQLLLPETPQWEAGPQEISRTFEFKDFHHTMAFVNAVAWVAHGEDHHPDLEVGYNRCKVRFSTHSVGGLSENDFICAAKVNALME
ncbi:MAG: 4a-hydroxytetrahydrobiopterin dehydratase [Planctomycetota bacterium]|nr:4a-hydroxytetrahydrobiopterin dehydratase [Planctomycetota bacterium]